MLNRWRRLCPSCFDAEAEKAGVRYSFTELEGSRGRIGRRRGTRTSGSGKLSRGQAGCSAISSVATLAMAWAMSTTEAS